MVILRNIHQRLSTTFQVGFLLLWYILYIKIFSNLLWFYPGLWFPSPKKLTYDYWNIVESGVKHHKTQPSKPFNFYCNLASYNLFNFYCNIIASIIQTNKCVLIISINTFVNLVESINTFVSLVISINTFDGLVI